jgi:hypothetical protein
MTRTDNFHLAVNIPSQDDFASRYPQYGRFAREEGSFLFDVVMSPACYDYARAATLVFNLPAVAGVAKACTEAFSRQNKVEWRDFIKQYIGALVCALMEANGFEKTGEKRAIPYPGFTKGEVYRLAGAPVMPPYAVEYCPRCRATRNMLTSESRTEVENADGSTRTVVNVTYQCQVCHSFVRSEQREEQQTPEA